MLHFKSNQRDNWWFMLSFLQQMASQNILAIKSVRQQQWEIYCWESLLMYKKFLQNIWEKNKSDNISKLNGNKKFYKTFSNIYVINTLWQVYFSGWNTNEYDEINVLPHNAHMF